MSDPNVVMILEKKTNIAMFILGLVRRNSFPYPRRQINVAYSKNVEMQYFIHNKIGIFSWSNYVFCPKQYKAITKIALSPYYICRHIFLYCRYGISLNRWIQFLNHVFEDSVWKLCLSIVFECCVWIMCLNTVFECCVWILCLNTVVWMLCLNTVF